MGLLFGDLCIECVFIVRSKPNKNQPTVSEDDTYVTQTMVEEETLEDLDIKIRKLMIN
jgi:hypothetical protein